MLESTGILIPGETILMAAGFLVRQGTPGLAVTIYIGALSTILGKRSGYWMGRTVSSGLRPACLIASSNER